MGQVPDDAVANACIKANYPRDAVTIPYSARTSGMTSCSAALSNWLVVDTVCRYLNYTDYLNFTRVVSELHGIHVMRGVAQRRHINNHWTEDRIKEYHRQLCELDYVLLHQLDLASHQPEIYLCENQPAVSTERTSYHMPFLPCWDQSGLEPVEMDALRQVRLHGPTPDVHIFLPYAKSIICNVTKRFAKFLDFTTQLLYVPTIGEMVVSLVHVQLTVDNHAALLRRLSTVNGIAFLSRVKKSKIVLIVDRKGCSKFDNVRYLVVVLHTDRPLLRPTLRLCGQRRFVFRHTSYICAKHMGVKTQRQPTFRLDRTHFAHATMLSRYEYLQSMALPTFNLLYRGSTRCGEHRATAATNHAADADTAAAGITCSYVPLMIFIDGHTQHEFEFFVERGTEFGEDEVGLRYVRTVE